MSPNIAPAKIVDGSDVYDKFTKEYVVHSKGLFILAPSGSGKTYFVKHQTSKDWIDGDKLWFATGAHPDMPWWTMGTDIINEVDQRSDLVTTYAKKLGLWIIGASQNWLIPDAIYIPDWEIHKQYIRLREIHDYDGGATSSDFDQVLGHIQYMRDLSKNKDVPIFKTIQEAVVALTGSIG